jgi:hypothetical protein
MVSYGKIRFRAIEKCSNNKDNIIFHLFGNHSDISTIYFCWMFSEVGSPYA